MPVVESSILIRCTPEQAFDLSQDYALRLKWDPFLADLKFLDGATASAVGVKTWVRSKRGLEMTTEYIAFDRPTVVAIKMLQGPRFFAHFAGSWRFRVSPTNAATTEATMRYTFDLAPHWRWSRPIAEPLIQHIFLKDVRARLAGLKRGIEVLRLHEQLPAAADS